MSGALYASLGLYLLYATFMLWKVLCCVELPACGEKMQFVATDHVPAAAF